MSSTMRIIFLAVLGLGIFFFSFDAALDVEEAYVTACRERACPSIARETHLLKLCAVVTAIAVPAGIGWFIGRFGDRA